MGFYIKLAWRNIFRNKRRTFLTGLIIGIGLASMIFTDASIVGMKENMISSATSSFLGEAEIHREGFQESQDNTMTIQDSDRIITMLKRDSRVKTFTERVISFGTVSSPADISSVVIYGIDGETEKAVSKIDESLTDGSYLTRQKGALIGADLAEELESSVGDRIVLTVSKAETGELSQDLFTVSGIFKMHIKEMDSSMVLIRLDEAQKLIGVAGKIHEIALQFQDIQYARNSGKAFSQKYSLFGNKAETWPELVPELQYILNMTDISIGIVVILVFAIIIFGIINTLFMSLYERTFEFGVLRAVGTRPAQMRNLIVFEAGSLALYSIILGMGLGFLVTFIGSVVGFDLTGVDLAGATFTGRIYTVFNLRQFTLHPFLILVFTVLVSLYPARHVSKMSITDALRRSL